MVKKVVNNLNNGVTNKFEDGSNLELNSNKTKSIKKKSTIMVDKDIDLEFRKVASSKFNFCRGWYTKAINEALAEWIEKYK